MTGQTARLTAGGDRCEICGNPGPGWHICISPEKPVEVTPKQPKKVAPAREPRPAPVRTPAAPRPVEKRTCVEDGCDEPLQKTSGRWPERCPAHKRERANALARISNKAARDRARENETPEQVAARRVKHNEYVKRYRDKQIRKAVQAACAYHGCDGVHA